MALQKRKMAGIDVTLHCNGEVIGGQINAELMRETLVIDTTHKGSENWSSAISRVNKWEVTCNGLVLTNDTGYGSLLDAYDEGEPVEVEIKHSSYKNFYYRGQAIITAFPEEYKSTDAVRYNLTLLGVSKLMRLPLETTKEE